MSYNTDSCEKSYEVTFLGNLHQSFHLPLLFNNNIVNRTVTQKYLGQLLDSELDFQEDLKNVESKILKQLHCCVSFKNITKTYILFISHS